MTAFIPHAYPGQANYDRWVDVDQDKPRARRKAVFSRPALVLRSTDDWKTKVFLPRIPNLEGTRMRRCERS